MSVDPGLIAGGLAAGALAGWAYFASLWHTARGLVGGGGLARTLLLGSVVRLPAMLGLLALAAWLGLEALGGLVVGFLAARTLALRRPPRRAGGPD